MTWSLGVLIKDFNDVHHYLGTAYLLKPGVLFCFAIRDYSKAPVPIGASCCVYTLLNSYLKSCFCRSCNLVRAKMSTLYADYHKQTQQSKALTHECPFTSTVLGTLAITASKPNLARMLASLKKDTLCFNDDWACLIRQWVSSWTVC